MIHQGDCVEVMAAMDAESIDAIVTDPPYGLEFMGKEWDRLKPDVRSDRGGVQAPGRAHRDAKKLAPVAYGGAPRRSTYTCDACGKRDKFKNDHGCGAAWSSLRLPDDHAAYGLTMQQWHTRWATEALRVAKPGAYLLAFGGTRTVHRLTVALEDAGWIIRDCLVWAYASGFPKSKSSLKPAWEPIVLARKPGPLAPLNIDECRLPTTDDNARKRSLVADTAAPFGKGYEMGGNGHRAGRWPANVILTDPIFDGGWEGVEGGGEATSGALRPYQRTTSNAIYGKGLAAEGATVDWVRDGDTGTYSRFFLLPKASRKDREPTVYLTCDCETVKLGEWESEAPSPSAPTDSTSPLRAISGATSTDDSGSPTSLSGNGTSGQSHQDTRSTTSTATSKTTGSRTSNSSTPSPTSGSIPAANSSTANGGSGAPSASYSDPSTMSGGTSLPKAGRSTGDADPAISARSSSPSVCADCGLPLPDREGGGAGRRGRVNVHPTQAVKPTRLMRHLIRLVTPEGGTVLDPFLGSGTTAKAAVLEGVEWVGIEREPEYIRIAEQRLVGLEPEPTQLEMTG